MSANAQQLDRHQKTPSQPKEPERDTIRAEIEQIWRIVNGANKKLERLCEQIKQK